MATNRYRATLEMNKRYNCLQKQQRIKYTIWSTQKDNCIYCLSYIARLIVKYTYNESRLKVGVTQVTVI
jgi:hypothetical protein